MMGFAAFILIFTLSYVQQAAAQIAGGRGSGGGGRGGDTNKSNFFVSGAYNGEIKGNPELKSFQKDLKKSIAAALNSLVDEDNQVSEDDITLTDVRESRGGKGGKGEKSCGGCDFECACSSQAQQAALEGVDADDLAEAIETQMGNCGYNCAKGGDCGDGCRAPSVQGTFTGDIQRSNGKRQLAEMQAAHYGWDSEERRRLSDLTQDLQLRDKLQELVTLGLNMGQPPENRVTKEDVTITKMHPGDSKTCEGGCGGFDFECRCAGGRSQQEALSTEATRNNIRNAVQAGLNACGDYQCGDDCGCSCDGNCRVSGEYNGDITPKSR